MGGVEAVDGQCRSGGRAGLVAAAHHGGDGDARGEQDRGGGDDGGAHDG